MGAVPGPFDAWLTLRGIRTLAVRMDRHCDNAERVVDMLAGHPRSAEVYYPGLPSHPGPRGRRHGRCAGSAGWCRSGCAGGKEEALKACPRTQIFTARRVAGRGRVADRAPGPDDAHERRRLGAGGAGRPDPAVRRHRGRRRPGRRPEGRLGLSAGRRAGCIGVRARLGVTATAAAQD